MTNDYLLLIVLFVGSSAVQSDWSFWREFRAPKPKGSVMPQKSADLNTPASCLLQHRQHLQHSELRHVASYWRIWGYCELLLLVLQGRKFTLCMTLITTYHVKFGDMKLPQFC